MLTAADHDDSAQGGSANKVPCHCRIAHNGNQSGRWFSMVVTQIFCWLCISRPTSIALGLVAGKRVKVFYRDKVREKKDRVRQRVSSIATDFKQQIKDRLGTARNSIVSSVDSMTSTGPARGVDGVDHPPAVCAQETEMVSIERTADVTETVGAARATNETILDDDTANIEESMCVTLHVRTASINLDDVCNEGRESKVDSDGGISEITRSTRSATDRQSHLLSGGDGEVEIDEVRVEL